MSKQRFLDEFLERHKDAPIMSVYRVALSMGYRGEDIRQAMIRFCRGKEKLIDIAKQD